MAAVPGVMPDMAADPGAAPPPHPPPPNLRRRHRLRQASLRGRLQPGDFLITNDRGTSRCKVYTAPPHVGGQYVRTLDQGEVIGPIEVVLLSEEFVTIYVDGIYINVERRRVFGAHVGNSRKFARKLTRSEIRHYHATGVIYNI